MSKTIQPGFLPLADAAAWAGVSPRTLRRWMAAGLPVYQGTTRGKLLIRPCDVETFLTRHQAQKPALDALVEEVLTELNGHGSRPPTGHIPSPRAIRRWTQDGLPVYRATAREKVLIRPSDIESFLTRRQAAKPNLQALVEELMNRQTTARAQ